MHPEEQTEMERKIALQAAQRREWDQQVQQRQQMAPADNFGDSDFGQAPHHKIVPPRRW